MVRKRDLPPFLWDLIGAPRTAILHRVLPQGMPGGDLNKLFENEPGLGLTQLKKQAWAGIEKQLILSALEMFDGNRTLAADSLRVSRRTLYTKLREYGIV